MTTTITITPFSRVNNVSIAAPQHVTWEKLVEKLAAFQRKASKRDVPGWAPTLFRPTCACGEEACPGERGHRAEANALEVYALVLDLDKKSDGSPLDATGAEAALARLGELGLRRVVHTTYSHAPPNAVALRVVIALSKPVLARDWPTFWPAAVKHLGIHVEPSCRNPDRFWYLPSAPSRPSYEPWSRAFEGTPLNVDAIITVARPHDEPKSRPNGVAYTPKAGDFDPTEAIRRWCPGAREYQRKDGRRCWDVECPWKHTHTPGSGGKHDVVASVGADGKPGFKCMHGHCANRAWPDFRKHHEPGYVPWEERQLGGSSTPRSASSPPPTFDEVPPPADSDITPSDADFARDKEGKILSTQANIALALAKLGVSLRFDVFANQELIEGLDGFGPFLDDAAMNRLRMKVDATFSFRVVKDFFYDVISDQARTRPFHPVRDYLGAQKWDGKPRVFRWLVEYAGADDTELTREIGRIVLVAAVRRVRQPGCKFDEMMVIESIQGTNKSSALRLLAVRDEWFTDDLPLAADTKRQMEATFGRWIVEAGELKGMSRGDVSSLKGYLSRAVDQARLAYGRKETRAPRQFVIIGTTNETAGYLKDATGNRRFWPVAVRAFDLEKLARDRDQLWAEAAFMEANGASIRLEPKYYGAAELEQDDRKIEEPFEILLSEALGDLVGKLRIVDTWRIVDVEPGKATQDQTARLGAAMRKLGWERARRHFDGSLEYAYVKGTDAQRERVLIVEGAGARVSVRCSPRSGCSPHSAGPSKAGDDR